MILIRLGTYYEFVGIVNSEYTSIENRNFAAFMNGSRIDTEIDGKYKYIGKINSSNIGFVSSPTTISVNSSVNVIVDAVNNLQQEAYSLKTALTYNTYYYIFEVL